MRHISKFNNFGKVNEELSPEVMEIIQGIGGMAAVAGVAFAGTKALLHQAKKEIIAKLKANGEEIPNDKELEKIAAQAVKTALDNATGANK